MSTKTIGRRSVAKKLRRHAAIPSQHNGPWFVLLTDAKGRPFGLAYRADTLDESQAWCDEWNSRVPDVTATAVSGPVSNCRAITVDGVQVREDALSQLCVLIETDGKPDRIVELDDPRDAFCRQYNAFGTPSRARPVCRV